MPRFRTHDAGRADAKAKGVTFSHKPKLVSHQRREAVRRRVVGATLKELVKSYNVGVATIQGWRLSATFGPSYAVVAKVTESS